jgi:hypothetical protein
VVVRNEQSELKIVFELIDQSIGEWDEEIVRETLCPLDADAALRLPRPRNGGDDLWA